MRKQILVLTVLLRVAFPHNQSQHYPSGCYLGMRHGDWLSGNILTPIHTPALLLHPSLKNITCSLALNEFLPICQKFLRAKF